VKPWLALLALEDPRVAQLMVRNVTEAVVRELKKRASRDTTTAPNRNIGKSSNKCCYARGVVR
jgi:hypothetical protein